MWLPGDCDMKTNQYPPQLNRQAGDGRGAQGMFRELEATELYCPNCRQAVPVRKRLLLILPDGDKYEYLCARCSGSVGTKVDRNTMPGILQV